MAASDAWFGRERGDVEIPALASLGLLYPFGGGLAVDIRFGVCPESLARISGDFIDHLLFVF